MDTGVETDSRSAYGGIEHSLVQSEHDVASQVVPIQRPTGITLIAGIYFILAVVCGIGVASGFYEYVSGRLSYSAAWQMAGLLVAGLTFFIFGSAFWQMREWVRIVTLFISFANLLAGGSGSEWWRRAIDIVLILYLMSSKVKEVFREVGRHEQPVIVDRWLIRR